MYPDFARLFLVFACFLAIAVYALYVKYEIERALRRTYVRAARQTLADAVALVQLHGAAALEEHRHLYADLSRRLKEMPLE